MWNISIAFSKYINSEVICLDTTKIYTHYTNPELRKIYEKVQEKC